MNARFIVLGNVLRASVHLGNDITDASSCLEAYLVTVDFVGIAAGMFKPGKDQILNTSEKKLVQYHQQVLERKNGVVRCYKTSGLPYKAFRRTGQKCRVGSGHTFLNLNLNLSRAKRR